MQHLVLFTTTKKWMQIPYSLKCYIDSTSRCLRAKPSAVTKDWSWSNSYVKNIFRIFIILSILNSQVCNAEMKQKWAMGQRWPLQSKSHGVSVAIQSWWDTFTSIYNENLGRNFCCLLFENLLCLSVYSEYFQASALVLWSLKHIDFC